MNGVPAALGLTPEQTREVLSLASAAPSLHNHQPWRFRCSDSVIELHYDPERRLSAADPEDRELRVGCGAALLNLRLALGHQHVRPAVQLLPSGAPTLLADVRVDARRTPPPAEEELFRAIPKRHTQRDPFSDTPVRIADQDAMSTAVHHEHGWLHVVPQKQYSMLETLARRAHRRQMADPDFRAELERWTGLPASEASGVPASAAGPLPEGQDRWVLRDYSRGQARQRPPGKDFETNPLLLVLGSYYSGRIAELRSGQALQRLLLTLTSLGMSASMMSQIVEVPETREQLREALAPAVPAASPDPQAVLRVGYGPPRNPTPRRPPEELVLA